MQNKLIGLDLYFHAPKWKFEFKNRWLPIKKHYGNPPEDCTEEIMEFIDSLLEAQAKQIRQEEAEKRDKLMEEFKKKLRAPQSRGAKKTNEILRKKNPNHWKDLAKKRWNKHSIRQAEK